MTKFIFALILLGLAQPTWAAESIIRVTSGDTELQIDQNLKARLVKPVTTTWHQLVDLRPAAGLKITAASVDASTGIQTLNASGKDLSVTLTLATPSEFPGAILMQLTLDNRGARIRNLASLTFGTLSLPTQGKKIWSFQPASFTKRPNWLREIGPGFTNKNFMGMNATDFGGGTPVAAVWTRAGGIAVGSVAPKPALIELPIVYGKKSEVTVGIAFKALSLKPQSQFHSPKSFILPFTGDAFQPLRNYSEYMRTQGLQMAESPMADIGPIWCAWGYGREFTVEQIIATLPKVKDMGFTWVGIDDGWQKSIGDWTVDTKKFPKGEEDLKRLVKAIHDLGMKAQLWWAPLAAHQKSDYVKQHGDQLLLNKNGKPREITWWDAWYICPAQTAALQEVKDLTQKFIGEWGFDGLKIDGQHLNASPECFNAKHNHTNSADSYTEHSQIFKVIYQAARVAKANAVVETCPCGTSFSIYNLPFQNMTVAADPESPLQVRQKGKILKAITGDQMVFFGDHADLVKGDFASTMAVGGVVGTNFVLPGLFKGKREEGEPDTELTPAREKSWRQWVGLANAKRLWEGQYLGALYDIGFDKPEAHAVRKGDAVYFAFFAKNFDGVVELRGLTAGQSYKVADYVNGTSLAVHQGPVAKVKVKFKEHLLLEALLQRQ